MHRTLPVLLALFFGLCAGAGLAWLLKPQAEQPTFPAAKTVQPAPAIPATNEMLQPVEDAQVADVVPTDEKLARQVAAADPGDGFIRGTVTWVDGAPCTGLALVADPVDPRAWQSNNTKGLTPAERDTLYRRRVAELAANALGCVTGEGGRFEIGGIKAGKYRVVSADRNVTVFSEKYPGTFEAGADASLKARRSIYIKVELTKAGGEILQKGVVWLLRMDNSSSISDQRWWPGREYPVTPRRWKVKAFDEPNGIWRAETEIDVPPEGLTEPVRLELRPNPCLVVRRKFNGPYYGHSVFLVSTDTLANTKGMSQDALGHEIGRRMGGWNYGEPNPTIVQELTPGRYTVFMLLGRSFVLASREFEYGGEYQELEIELPDAVREDHIVLRVIGPDDKPLGGATIEIRVVESGFSARAALERSTGEYWIRRIPPSNLTWECKTTRTEYIVHVSHRLYGSRVVSCPVDMRDELTLKFAGLCKLSVLLDNLPRERGNVEIAALPKGESEARAFERHSRLPLASDRNEFELAAGPAVVVVRLNPEPKQAYSQSVILWREEIDLPPGARELRVTLPDLSDLRLKVPESSVTSWVSIRSDRLKRTVRPDVAGIVEFRQLPPGTYIVTCDAGCMALELPVYGEVELRVQPFNALRVAYLDSGGIFAQVGLKAGDLIRLINGSPVGGTATDMRETLKRAADGGQCVLTVERAGLTFTVNATREQWATMTTFGVSAVRVE